MAGVLRTAPLAGVLALLIGASFSAGEAPAAGAERLLKRLVQDGDTEALLALTHHLSVDEISARMKAISPLTIALAARPKASVKDVHKGVEQLGRPAMAFDSTGRLHLAFCGSRLVPGPDHLGNRRRRRTNLYYTSQGGAEWSKPRVLLDDELYVNGLRLLVDGEDTAYVLCFGHNARLAPTRSGLKPGLNDLLVFRRPRGGEWSAPRSLLSEHPKLVHGLDACLDGSGSLHLVWSPWKDNRTRQVIHYRRCVGGNWQETRVLPGVAGYNLTYPRIRWTNGALHVFAAGQTPDYQSISTYHLTCREGQWGEPKLLLHKTAFRHQISEGRAFVLASLYRPGPWQGAYVLFGPDAKGRIRRRGQFLLPGTRMAMIPNYGWSYPSLAADPKGRPLAVIAESGHLYLLRLGPGGATEAVCLWHGGAGRGAAGQISRLAVRGRRLHVVWLESDKGLISLRHLETDVPDRRWQPLNVLYWRLRAGAGLGRNDRALLRARILSKARAHDRALEMAKAVGRYLYVLANFHDGTEPHEVRRRLLELDQAGITEVKRQLWAMLRDDPKLPQRTTPGAVALGRLMRQLSVRPGGKGGAILLARPPQDKSTVRKLLAASKHPSFVVFLADGKEAVIRPDLKKLQELKVGGRRFAEICRRRLEGAKPEAIEKTAIPVGGPARAQLVAALGDLAGIDIRPQHTGRVRYLLGWYFKVSAKAQVELRPEIVEHAREAVPLLFARFYDEPFARSGLGWGGAHRYAAKLLVHLARKDKARKRIVEWARRLLFSVDPDERGWSNHVLVGIDYEGEAEELPVLLLREDDTEVTVAILARLRNRLTRRPGLSKKLQTDAPWREFLTDVLESLLASDDPRVASAAAGCLRDVPTKRSTAIMVDALAQRKPWGRSFIGAVKKRTYRLHPAALSAAQQRRIVPGLIRIKMTEPDWGSDTTTDILMNIPDKRVLPAFFEMLERHKDNVTIQRQASYSIWIIFTKSPGLERPAEVRDFKVLTAAPVKAGAAWRRWHRQHRHRLRWDEEAMRYGLEAAAPTRPASR